MIAYLVATANRLQAVVAAALVHPAAALLPVAAVVVLAHLEDIIANILPPAAARVDAPVLGDIIITKRWPLHLWKTESNKFSNSLDRFIATFLFIAEVPIWKGINKSTLVQPRPVP